MKDAPKALSERKPLACAMSAIVRPAGASRSSRRAMSSRVARSSPAADVPLRWRASWTCRSDQPRARAIVAAYDGVDRVRQERAEDARDIKKEGNAGIDKLERNEERRNEP